MTKDTSTGGSKPHTLYTPSILEVSGGMGGLGGAPGATTDPNHRAPAASHWSEATRAQPVGGEAGCVCVCVCEWPGGYTISHR